MHMVGVFKSMMRELDARLALDGRGADICLPCATSGIRAAQRYPRFKRLNSSRPMTNLLGLGSISYPSVARR